ncbi:hypothetical protein VTK26DRAFT_2223 [Humicola hyalothermophila]
MRLTSGEWQGDGTDGGSTEPSAIHALFCRPSEGEKETKQTVSRNPAGDDNSDDGMLRRHSTIGSELPSRFARRWYCRRPRNPSNYRRRCHAPLHGPSIPGTALKLSPAPSATAVTLRQAYIHAYARAASSRWNGQAKPSPTRRVARRNGVTIDCFEEGNAVRPSSGDG